MSLPDRCQESILENELKVLTAELHTSPTVSLQLFYRVGSRNERPGITGISHIFEHLMFKGTERFPEGQFDRRLQENGMTYNAFTTKDFTCFYENMATDRLPIALELEADRMQGLALEEKSFQSELAVIREERKETTEDPPFGLLMEAVQAAVFMVHPYRWPVIGWMSDLLTITLENVRAYYRDYYRPNNAVLVVSGDVTHAQVLEEARRYFSPIDPGPPLPKVLDQEPPQQGERTVSVAKAVQLPGIIVTFRAPEAWRREAKVLNLIEFLLLHGRSSRLYKRMIYREQLATGLAGGLNLRAGPSTFGFRASARPGVTLERLRDALYEELERLCTTTVQVEELQKALNAVESDFVFAQESALEIGQNLGEEECRSTWRDYLRWWDEHRTITAEEIRTVAAETFAGRRRTVGLLIPEAGLQAAQTGTGGTDGAGGAAAADDRPPADAAGIGGEG